MYSNTNHSLPKPRQSLQDEVAQGNGVNAPSSTDPRLQEYWRDIARQRLALINAPPIERQDPISLQSLDNNSLMLRVLRELDGIEKMISLVQRAVVIRQAYSQVSIHELYKENAELQRSHPRWMLALQLSLALSLDADQVVDGLVAVGEQTLLRELDALRYALSLVQETRNACCSPVSTMSKETLMCIFEYCIEQVDPNSETYLFQHVVVTFVCRRWRSVALDAPSYWANVMTIPERWVDAFLQRSKAAPVTMSSDGQLGGSAHSHLWHVESLTLTRAAPRIGGGADSSTRLFGGISGNSAPMLKRVVISHGQGQVLDGRLLLSAPHLHELEVSGFLLNWTSFHWQNLRTLILETRSDDDYETYPRRALPGDFLSLVEGLKRSVHLQKLVLREYIPSSPHTPTSGPLSPAMLGSLRELQLADSATRCAQLLSNIRVPLSSAKLNFRLHGGDEVGMRAFILSLNQCAGDGPNEASSPPIRTLVFDSTGVELWGSEEPSLLQIFNLHNPVFKGVPPLVNFEVKRGVQLFADPKASLLNVLPFKELVTVSIEMDRHAGSELGSVWVEFLSTATRVSHLRIVGPPVHGFLQELQSSPRRIATAGEESVHSLALLPALRDVFLGRFQTTKISLEIPLHQALPGCIARLGDAKLDSIWLFDVDYKPEWIDPLRPLAEEILLPGCHRLKA